MTWPFQPSPTHFKLVRRAQAKHKIHEFLTWNIQNCSKFDRKCRVPCTWIAHSKILIEILGFSGSLKQKRVCRVYRIRMQYVNQRYRKTKDAVNVFPWFAVSICIPVRRRDSVQRSDSTWTSHQSASASLWKYYANKPVLLLLCDWKISSIL